MVNPYAPPSAAPMAPPCAAVVLAWTEIIAGLALGSSACANLASLGDDGHLVRLAAMMAWVVVFVALVLPGVVLLKVRHPARWLAQALPLALVVMLLVEHTGGST